MHDDRSHCRSVLPFVGSIGDRVSVRIIYPQTTRKAGMVFEGQTVEQCDSWISAGHGCRLRRGRLLQLWLPGARNHRLAGRPEVHYRTFTEQFGFLTADQPANF